LRFYDATFYWVQCSGFAFGGVLVGDYRVTNIPDILSRVYFDWLSIVQDGRRIQPTNIHLAQVQLVAGSGTFRWILREAATAPNPARPTEFRATATNALITTLGAATFVPVQLLPATYSGMYTLDEESGAGLSIVVGSGAVFMSWYTYDDTGRARWLVIPNGQATSSTVFAGDIYETTYTGSGAFTGAVSGAQTQARLVGNARVTFTGANGVIGYTVNGVTRSRVLKRLAF
jgi:hypothetical protein